MTDDRQRQVRAHVEAAHAAMLEAQRVAYDNGNRPRLSVRLALNGLETRLLRLALKLSKEET